MLLGWHVQKPVSHSLFLQALIVWSGKSLKLKCLASICNNFSGFFDSHDLLFCLRDKQIESSPPALFEICQAGCHRLLEHHIATAGVDMLLTQYTLRGRNQHCTVTCLCRFSQCYCCFGYHLFNNPYEAPARVIFKQYKIFSMMRRFLPKSHGVPFHVLVTLYYWLWFLF